MNTPKSPRKAFDLAAFHDGAYVASVKFGVGRVRGKTTATVGGLSMEFIEISYEGTSYGGISSPRQLLPIENGKVMAQDAEPLKNDKEYWKPVFSALMGKGDRLKINNRKNSTISTAYVRARAAGDHVAYAQLLYQLRDQFTNLDPVRYRNGTAYQDIIGDMMGSLAGRLAADTARDVSTCDKHIMAVLIGAETKPESVFSPSAKLLDGYEIARNRRELALVAPSRDNATHPSVTKSGLVKVGDLPVLPMPENAKDGLDLRLPVQQAIYEAIARRNTRYPFSQNLLQKYLADDLETRLSCRVSSKMLAGKIKTDVAETETHDVFAYWFMHQGTSLRAVIDNCPQGTRNVDFFNRVFQNMQTDIRWPLGGMRLRHAIDDAVNQTAATSLPTRSKTDPVQSDSSAASTVLRRGPRPK